MQRFMGARYVKRNHLKFPILSSLVAGLHGRQQAVAVVLIFAPSSSSFFCVLRCFNAQRRSYSLLHSFSFDRSHGARIILLRPCQSHVVPTTVSHLTWMRVQCSKTHSSLIDMKTEQLLFLLAYLHVPILCAVCSDCTFSWLSLSLHSMPCHSAGCPLDLGRY